LTFWAQRATLELSALAWKRSCLFGPWSRPHFSLLGLIRHLADVERRWFRRVLAGQDVSPVFSSKGAPDGDFDGAVSDPTVIGGGVGSVAF